eukprot:SAG22_NODE_43_length_25304_cov_5.394644_9_plen_177_part_00
MLLLEKRALQQTNSIVHDHAVPGRGPAALQRPRRPVGGPAVRQRQQLYLRPRRRHLLQRGGEATVLSSKGSDHCLFFCFSAFPCGSTALTSARCNQALAAVIKQFVAARTEEMATFTHGKLVSPPLLPGEACEGQGCTVAICCDQNPFAAPAAGKKVTCDCNGAPYSGPTGPPDRK